MKIVLLACLVAAAAAAPQLQTEERPVKILIDERSDSGDGNFNYAFEAENGIAMEVSGSPGAGGQSNMQGSYRFILPDGTTAEVRFFADENGYRAESPLIPTAHPLPAHALEQIRFAEEQLRLAEQQPQQSIDLRLTEQQPQQTVELRLAEQQPQQTVDLRLTEQQPQQTVDVQVEEQLVA